MYILYNRIVTKPLPTTVTMTELRENLAAYLDAAEAGKTITVTRRGRPSVRLEAAGTEPQPLEPSALKAFRASLAVRVPADQVVRMRQDERT